MRALGRIALANMYTITCALSVRGHHKISSPPLTLPLFHPPSFYPLSSRRTFLRFRSPCSRFRFRVCALRPRSSQNLFSAAHAPSLPSPVVLFPFAHGARSYVSARHVSFSVFACALSVRGHHKISSPPLTLPHFPPPSFYPLSPTVRVSPFPLTMFQFSPTHSPSEVIAKSLLHRSRFLAFLTRRSSFLSPSAPLFFDICGQNAENRRIMHTRRRVHLHRFSRSKGTKCPFFGAQPEICRAGAHIAPSFP